MSSRPRSSLLLLTLTLTLPLAGPAPATAAILPVTICTDNGAQTRSQILAASPGDTVVLPPGCHITLTAGGGPLQIPNTVNLVGAGASQTILDGGNATGVLRVDAASGSVTVGGLTIQHGNAVLGGGIHLVSGSLALTNSSIILNRADRNGGGIHVDVGATLMLTNSVVGLNSADQGGGIYNVGTLTVTGSTVAGNVTVTGSPGGIAAYGTGTTLSNSTVSGNLGSSVGGISACCGPAELTVTHSTIAGNTGIGISVAPGTTVTLRATLVANNTGGNCTSAGTLTSLGHNLDSGTTCGFTFGQGDLTNVTNPLLGPLAVNGGPTPTMALLAGSPAIDAAGADCLPTDQRGVPTPVDGNGTGVALCDIGAYEFQPAPVVPAAVLRISPASGTLVSTQHFDLVLDLQAPGVAVVGGQALVDGIDVSAGLAHCLVPGTRLAGGQTFRCPGVTGSLLAPGLHTVAVSLALSNGSTVSDTALWQIDPNREP